MRDSTKWPFAHKQPTNILKLCRIWGGGGDWLELPLLTNSCVALELLQHLNSPHGAPASLLFHSTNHHHHPPEYQLGSNCWQIKFYRHFVLVLPPEWRWCLPGWESASLRLTVCLSAADESTDRDDDCWVREHGQWSDGRNRTSLGLISHSKTN